MALYEYECSIHGTIEIQHSIKDTIEYCPKCQEEGLEPQKIIRLISLSSFVLNGSGWSKDNYK